MKKIDKLILKSFLGPFFLTFVVVVFILLTQTLIKYFDEFVGKDLGFAVFSELIFYFSLTTTPVALPLAMLLSTLICFGNLGEHYELTAIKSSGISLIRVLFPIFIFAILLTFVAFWFNNTIVPHSNLNAYSLLWDIRQKKPSLDIKEGVFYNGLTGFSIKANKKILGKDGKEILLDVMLYNHQDGNGNNQVILADSAKMYTTFNERYLILELFRGNSYAVLEPDARKAQKDEFQRDAFEQSKWIISLASFDLTRTKKELFSSSKYMMNVRQLQHVADSVYNDYSVLRKSAPATASQYYYNHFKPLPAKVDSIQGNWMDSLSSRKLEQYAIQDILVTAASQARNMKSFTQSHVQQIEYTLKESRTFTVEKYKKYTQSVACLIMFLIGAPLGAIIKKGGLGIPVLVSITFFIIFYVLSLLGEKWAREGMISIPPGVWAANSILLLCGLFFLRQARNDSRLFEADMYKVAFSRLIEKWHKLFPARQRKMATTPR
jgi:lipopolysaccharide export system permease protein